jgi:hypothetical protein
MTQVVNLGPTQGLPAQSRWDSVTSAKPVTIRSPVFRLLCEHGDLTEYTRIDHRAGPGGYSDSYKGLACVLCSKLITEMKVF